MTGIDGVNANLRIDALHRDAAEYAAFCGESYGKKRRKSRESLTVCSCAESIAGVVEGRIGTLQESMENRKYSDRQ